MMCKNLILIAVLFLFINSNSQNPVKVGDFAPKIKVTDKILNYPNNLSLKNKFIVLEFWATWCKPCIEAVPKLNFLEEKFSKNKNLVFISITNESPKKALTTLQKVPFKSIVVSDQTGITIKKFIETSDGSVTIPATILIDDKNIVKWIGTPQELNEIILHKFLKNKKIKIGTTISNKKMFQPVFRKQFETNISDLAYRTVNNDSTQLTFSLIRNKPYNNYLNSNYLKRNKTYMDFNKSVEGILANLNNVNKSQITIPDSLKNRNYSLFFKNSNLKNESDGLKEIKNKIQEFFNVKEKIIFLNQNNYILQLIDEKKFEKTRNVPISNQNNENGKLIFSAVEIEKIVFDVSSFFKINIKDETKLNGYLCNFILPNGSVELINEALQNYGLKLQLISDKTPVFIYE